MLMICEQIKTGECLQMIYTSEMFISGGLAHGFTIAII